VIGTLRRLSHVGLQFGGALILLAALLIGVDVILRKFFSASIGGADELAGYALAIGTSWGLAAALVDRAHIRIDSFYVLLPAGLRFALDVSGVLLLVGFFGLVAWHAFGVVEQSWTSGSRSQSALETPTVIPQLLWWLGLAGFVLIGAALLVLAIGVRQRSGWAAAARLIGTRSAEEEVEDEIRDIARRHDDGGPPP
jgi:TRAP-type C4-dicarboxylate transport system permease small subunit